MALRPLVITVAAALSLGFPAIAQAQPSAPSSDQPPASLVFATPDGLFQQRLEGLRQPLLSLGSALVEDLAWSPRGDVLAVVKGDGQVVWITLSTGQAQTVFSSPCQRRQDLNVAWQAQPPVLVIQEQCEDPDGQDRWTVWLTDAPGAQRSLALPPNAAALSVSPNGRHMAYVADQHIYVLDAATTQGSAANGSTRPRQITDAPGTYAAAGSALVWSPDSTQLAFHEGNYPFQRIQVIDMATGEQRLLTPDANFQIYRSRLRWSPNGRYLAFYEPFNPPLSNQEVVVVLEVSTGERQVLTRPGFYNALSWSPDSQTLAFSSGNHWEQQAMFTVALADQAFTTLTPQPFQSVSESWWSPQGDWIAFSAIPLGDDLGTQGLYVVRPDGSELTPLTQANEYAFPVAWKPR